MTIEDARKAVAAYFNFGTPSARKSGRNPKWPYIPVVKSEGYGTVAQHSKVVKGLAYATREEAVARSASNVLNRLTAAMEQSQ